MNERTENLIYLIMGVGALILFIYVQIVTYFIPIFNSGRISLNDSLLFILSISIIILLSGFILWFGVRYIKEKN